MALFSSFKKLFDFFIPCWYRREAQQCAAQELAAVNKCSESEAFTANPNTCRKKCRKGAKKCRDVRPFLLKLIKGKRAKLPSGSGDFIVPAACFKPLPPVKRPQMCPVQGPEQQFVLPGCPLYVDQPKLLASLPHPVPAPDELFSHQFSTVHPLRPIPVQELEHEFVLPGCPIQVHPPKQLTVLPSHVPAPDELFSTVCPIPPPRACAPLRSVCSLSSLSSSSVRSASGLDHMFSDTEDEESEFAENIQTFLKPERPRLMKQILAWEEEEVEQEVLDEESWTSEVFEDLSETGDSEAEHDIATLTPFDGGKSRLSGNVLEEPKNRRKVPMVLFTWAEEKVKENVERKLQKERERRERQLLYHRYRNDPKLKHLWINKHNHNYI